MSPNEDVPVEANPAFVQALGVLQSHKARWATMEPGDRLAYLEKILARLQGLDHERWGTSATRSYGLRPEHPVGDFHVAMESMVNVSVMAGTIKHLIRTATAHAKDGAAPTLARTSRDGREVVQVFPIDRDDRFSQEGRGGCTGEVWLDPKAPSHAEPAGPEGIVCLVLGAGNQSFLAFGDVMYHLFVEGAVCVLKHHPLRAFSAPFFDEIFADLIEDGFFFACEADLEETGALVHSPLVDRVHMTGGTATHDAIVWGPPGPEQRENKARNAPVLHKPMSSELGSVTPWIVLPGASWTDAEVSHMAGHLVAAFTAQNSCNCLSPKLVVLDADWPGADAFLAAVRDRLGKVPLVPPHYPGTAKRYQGFVDAYPADRIESVDAPQIEGIADHGLGPCLPWLLLHLDESSAPYAWQTEAFAPVLAIYKVRTGNDPKAFVESVVPFVNGSVWGSLSCTLIAHPDVDSTWVEQAITDLRYGSIGLNAWTAGVYGMSGMTWGAYPGEPLNHVASGRGIVRNAYALPNVEKSVLRSPFITSSQLVVNEAGRFHMNPTQLRAIRRVLLWADLRSILALVRLMASPKPGHTPTLRQRSIVWTIRAIQGMLSVWDRIRGTRSPA